ncbi:MAG: DNA-binding NtrC family response regulator [Candidatus Latescibacterota bacterium]|jgi:DNA-binding NtrC family response regulator
MIKATTLRGTVLVCEDDGDYRQAIVRALQQEDHQVIEAENGTNGLQQLAEGSIDVVVTDLQMPGADGIEILRAATAQAPPVPTLIMTGFASAETAVKAMKLGALDYLIKPVDIQDLQLGVHQALERRRMFQGGAEGQAKEFGDLLGASAAMQSVYDQIRRVAPFKSTVLITGESGTGKELVSRAIHALSPVESGPFIAVNCSAMPSELIESQLFGHEKGSFTGASAQYKGFFEAADGGTLFLDEIGDLPLEAQTKMLRVLEDRQITRLGSTKPVDVNVRLVAATNIDLLQAVGERRFREDLYYRLNVLRVILPTLRERREDIPLLVRIFLDQFARENGVPPREIDQQALTLLQTFDWPGNVRELKNITERLAVMARGETIQIEDVPEDMHSIDTTTSSSSPDLDPFSGLTGLSINEIEEAVIRRTLEHTGNNRTRAAQMLNISLRTLQRKLKEYGEDE